MLLPCEGSNYNIINVYGIHIYPAGVCQSSKQDTRRETLLRRYLKICSVKLHGIKCAMERGRPATVRLAA